MQDAICYSLAVQVLLICKKGPQRQTQFLSDDVKSAFRSDYQLHLIVLMQNHQM